MKLKIEPTRETAPLPAYISEIPKSFEDALSGTFTPVPDGGDVSDTVLRTLILHREMSRTNFAVTPKIRELLVGIESSPFLELPTKDETKFIFCPDGCTDQLINYHCDSVKRLLSKLGKDGKDYMKVNIDRFIKDSTLPDMYVLMGLSLLYIGLLRLDFLTTTNFTRMHYEN